MVMERLDLELHNLNAARHAWLSDLSEAFNLRLPELNEQGWAPLGQSADMTASGLNRVEVNRQARKYYHTDPIARHLVELPNAYTFSRGVSWRAVDPDMDAVLQRFWVDPRNRMSLTRASKQHTLNRNLQLDGELFLAFYTSTLDGRVTVRQIPAAQVTKVVRHPDDAAMLLYIEREYQTPTGMKRQRIFDYRIADTRPDELQPPDMPANTQVSVMHIIYNDFNGRGISTLTTSIPWIKALKGFMEDRATLTMALATFAWRQKIRGNRAAVARAVQQWQTYENQINDLRYGGEGDGRERRQGANTVVQNDAMELEQIRTDSGAANAYQDMRMFRQQVGIGKGIFEHYLGDPSTGNLATATAMELPMLKLFEYNQQFWTDVLEDIGMFVARQAARYGDLGNLLDVDIDLSSGVPFWMVTPRPDVDTAIEVRFPPIIQRDITTQAAALAQIAQAELAAGQSLVPAMQKAEFALGLLGYNNVSEILTDLAQEPTMPDPNQRDETQREAMQPLDLPDAMDVPPITDDEVAAQADDWSRLPSLVDLAQELGLSEEELDDA